MTETERRRTYTETQVLISSSAVLSPTFPDGALYFTGAQVEIMRNLMQYANRPDNYAAQWETGYYLIPDDDDWDDILTVVADLEETLMGNPNTLWGYKDRINVQTHNSGCPAGTVQVNLDVVQSGKVQRLTHITVFDGDSVVTTITLAVIGGSITHYLALLPTPAAGVPHTWSGDITLKFGDYISAMFYGCTLGDELYLQAVGYEMTVP